MILNNIYFKKPSEFKKNELIDCFNKFYPQKSKFLIKNWGWFAKGIGLTERPFTLGKIKII